ncbi:RDD family protein [Ascidiimonas sp. W6]|uniref:RDD family protein n=1 Tax=Ascidiimonas meishanensis TaxID=3128903 RepID=UPI0030EC9913
MSIVNRKRIIAFIIDILVISTFVNICCSAVSENYSPSHLNIQYFSSLLLPGMFIGVYIIYILLFDVIFEGQTLGKLASSILVVESNNDTIPDLKKRVIRSLTKFLSILLLPLSVLLFISKRGFTIHEKISKSRTIMNTWY